MPIINCDLPPTHAQLIATEARLTTAFAEVKAEGYFLPASKITFKYNTISAASTDATGLDIWASPGHLVCFSHDQLKGTLIHEAGHFADPLYQRASQQAVLQEFFLLGAAAAVAICTLNLLFTRKNERPHPTLNKIGGFALAGFLLTHSINGAWLLEQRIKLEKRADHFTAVKMGSGEALAGSIEILQTMNDDGLAKNKKPNYLIRAATYFEDWYVFGIAGFCGDVCMHPPAQERINVLRAYKPRKPLPTASNERASHMVLN